MGNRSKREKLFGGRACKIGKRFANRFLEAIPLKPTSGKVGSFRQRNAGKSRFTWGQLSRIIVKRDWLWRGRSLASGKDAEGAERRAEETHALRLSRKGRSLQAEAMLRA
tara:strand:- start:12259 stop:12588 length:330 start_codon:yes stop_codon:yes gene_type:complete